MSQLTAKIEAFADLPEAWDSYGALRISATAIHRAVVTVEYLNDMALDETITVSAFPVSTGIVQLDLNCAVTGRGVEIDCDEKGTATVTYFDRDNDLIKGPTDVHCHTIETFLLQA